LAPGLLDFGRYGGQMGWATREHQSASRISSRRPIRDRLWRRGVSRRPEGLAQARLRHRASTRRSYRRTLKIYEADLNGGSTPHEPDLPTKQA